MMILTFTSLCIILMRNGATSGDHMNSNPGKPAAVDRLTITLGPGQREMLEAIAQRNRTTLAFVVRYALDRFVETSESGQLRLSIPS
jgi:hypothetical protein